MVRKPRNIEKSMFLSITFENDSFESNFNQNIRGGSIEPPREKAVYPTHINYHLLNLNLIYAKIKGIKN